MKHLLKIGLAAAAAMFMTNAPASAALTTTTFCEDVGSPLAGGAHPGRCSAGDISTGTFDITNYDAGSFGLGEKLIFKGYGDNGDLDQWTFTANTAFRFTLESFVSSGVGTSGGILDAFLTDPNGVVTHLTSAIIGQSFGIFAAGTYIVSVLGSVAPTDLYNYDLSVQAIPVPGAAVLFVSALFGGAFASRRRRKAA